MPISEHPFDGSWGYQPVGYFAPTSGSARRTTSPTSSTRCTRTAIGVILDWVPAHFPRDLHGLGYFDGTHLYEHEDPRLGEHRDWGTKIFNYGRPEVRNFLFGNALFWLERYHIDGLRVDAVASMLYLDYSRKPGDWVPNIYGGNENLEAIDFIKRLNELCHQRTPRRPDDRRGIDELVGRLAPDLPRRPRLQPQVEHGLDERHARYMSKDPVYRKYEHGSLTFSMIYAFNENFMLPLSHDEVVHGKGSLIDKMPGDLWQKFANLRLLYGYMYGHPGKKLLFMGERVRPVARVDARLRASTGTCSSGATIRGCYKLVSDLNALYQSEPAFYQVDFEWQGFEWLELHDWENSVLAFLRRARDPRTPWSSSATSRRSSAKTTGSASRPAALPRDPQYRLRHLRRLERRQRGGRLGAAGAARREAVSSLAPRSAAGCRLPQDADCLLTIARAAGRFLWMRDFMRHRPRLPTATWSVWPHCWRRTRNSRPRDRSAAIRRCCNVSFSPCRRSKPWKSSSIFWPSTGPS